MTSQIFKGIRRALHKRVAVNQPGMRTAYTTAPDGFEVADIEVTVDFERIANHIGVSAMENRSGRSAYMNGAIVATVVRRSRVEG